MQNPKDPILKSGPAAQMELFNLYRSCGSGFPVDAVLGASVNMVVNALRQTYPTRDKAMARLDEIVAATKGLLAQNYDATGRKRGIVPSHQVISVPFIADKDTIN